MNIKSQNGYIALASVLVITVVVLFIGTTVALLSVNDIQAALSNKKGEESIHLVEGCIEDVLLRLNETNTIPASIVLPEGTCTVTTNSHTGNNWTFTVNGGVNNIVKNIQVSVTRDSTVTITSWIEV